MRCWHVDWKSNPDSQVAKPVAYKYTEWATPVPNSMDQRLSWRCNRLHFLLLGFLETIRQNSKSPVAFCSRDLLPFTVMITTYSQHPSWSAHPLSAVIYSLCLLSVFTATLLTRRSPLFVVCGRGWSESHFRRHDRAICRLFKETKWQKQGRGEIDSWKPTGYGTWFPWIRTLRAVNSWKPDRCYEINIRVRNNG
jgi:hypothetical protein